MSLIVQKYGGTSVANLKMIKMVASKVIEQKNRGNDVVVVVSAMAGETDRLISLSRKINPKPDPREFDSLIASGEQVSSSLLAMAIQTKGIKACSLLAHQIPIMTDENFSSATIAEINYERITQYLKDDNVVVIAGFQGVSETGDITTFGRGGSDITAVALAGGLKADLCQLYKDVPGVFTADPGIVSNARLLKEITHDEMMELASMGAKIVHPRAVQLARKFGVSLEIKGTFNDGRGTMISKSSESFEGTKVMAITCNKKEAKISIMNIPNDPKLEHRLFQAVADCNVWIDMIVQSVSRKGVTDITFTAPRNDSERLVEILRNAVSDINGAKVYCNKRISKVSVIGDAMRIHPSIAARIFKTMAKEDINIITITTSQLKISLAIDEKYAELAVRSLHEEFGLEKES